MYSPLGWKFQEGKVYLLGTRCDDRYALTNEGAGKPNLSLYLS